MGIQFTGLASGIDTQSIITDLMKVERMKVETVEKKKTIAEWKKDAWEEMNTKLYSFYKEELYAFKSEGSYNKKTVTSTNESMISVNTSNNAVRGSHTIDVTTMAKGSFLTGTELTDVSLSTTAEDLFTFVDPANDIKTISISLDNGATTHDVTIEASDTLAEIVEKFEDLDLNLNISYDETFNRMFLSTSETGGDKQILLTGDDEVLTNLGFAAVNRQGDLGTDAEFIYNGTTLTSSTNEVSVNGLSFNINGEGGSATLNVVQDTDAIYDSVKNFILKYNDLLMEINEKLDADSAREFEPLTDEEKNAMTEDDIELWEEKIKTSLLRRDDKLTYVKEAMRSTMALASGVDTSNMKYKSLSALGIVTTNYEEKGVLHIEGDEDEALLNVKDNKLRNAIEEDPEEVMSLLTGIGQSLYDDFSERIKSSTMNSAFKFYNDKLLDDDISDYQDDIYDLEDRMGDIEARYYSQFTAMEQAIQKANSTGEWLAQQLGGM